MAHGVELSAYILQLIVWVYRHWNFSGELCKTFYWKNDVSAVHGHPRSLILVPTESSYATSYYSVIATLVLTCTISEILPFLCLWPHLYSTLILACSHWTRLPMLDQSEQVP